MVISCRVDRSGAQRVVSVVQALTGTEKGAVIMDLKTGIFARRSVEQFDPAAAISKEDIEKVIEAAGMAPSSYNLQHWHFLVIHDMDRKKALRNTAYDQQKVQDAAAAIVVLGNLKAHERARYITDDQVEKGYLTAEGQKKALAIISGYYDSAENQRMEAIRGASLAAMSLLLAAEALGYDTCPMAGFDLDAMRREFKIPEHLLPVMIVAIGRSMPEPRPRKMRLPVAEVITYDSF